MTPRFGFMRPAVMTYILYCDFQQSEGGLEELLPFTILSKPRNCMATGEPIHVSRAL